MNESEELNKKIEADLKVVLKKYAGTRVSDPAIKIQIINDIMSVLVKHDVPSVGKFIAEVEENEKREITVSFKALDKAAEKSLLTSLVISRMNLN